MCSNNPFLRSFLTAYLRITFAPAEAVKYATVLSQRFRSSLHDISGAIETERSLLRNEKSSCFTIGYNVIVVQVPTENIECTADSDVKLSLAELFKLP